MILKLTKKVTLSCAGLIGICMISGILFQSVSTQLDEFRYPPTGELVDIGGYRLHINYSGEGGPTVILDSGLGCNSMDWSLVQPEIAKFTKVCSYDRAGNGWSDTSPLARTSLNIVEELHTLLTNADIPQPYILVGHSFGGANARLFASRYPDEVLGIILVDAAHEDSIRKMPSLAKNIDTGLNDNLLYLTYLGVLRCAQYLPQFQKAIQVFPAEIQTMYYAKKTNTKFIRTMLDEWSKIGESFDQLKSAEGNIADKPLIVITARKTMTAEESGWPQEDIDKMTIFNLDLQCDLVTKSTKGKHIFAENSGHMIPHQQPEIIVDAIHEMVNDARK